MGVKFQTSTAGKVTAIRFYKTTLNAGPHTVSLWSSAGSLLASATSTTETASGWQQVNLPNGGVTLAANTTYVAAYHSNGYYSATLSFFGSPIKSGPLTALASARGSGNGVYVYGSATTFPNQSYEASNYWVDFVFSY
jgi:Domain of unknown function (DUF4082)